ncbi:hypothetical protein MP638_001479 [Amoeboaphelidium occidentale]|nr:hypothetical protein MP638_001479 [Amoeboaphelidium occidentale]
MTKEDLALPATTRNWKSYVPVPSFQSVIVASLVAAFAGTFSALSGKTPWYVELTKGTPKEGELGLGRFVIEGTSIYFQYPFKLLESNFNATATAVLGYLIHQVGQFIILYKAREAKEKGLLTWTSNDRMNPYAKSMLALNIVCAVLHYLQTQYFYDGLAAILPEVPLLFAGVSCLIVVFIFKFRTRGIAFGWKANWPLLKEFCDFVGKYHGYIASFSIILTFWHHPFEATWSHLTGFFHISLLLFQSSTLLQEAHRNKYWAALLEITICVHGTVVAYYQNFIGGALFRMFLSSYILLYILSVIWGLPITTVYLSREPKSVRYYALIAAMLSTFTVFALWLYQDQMEYLPMVFALPGMYYAFAMWYFAFFIIGKRVDEYLQWNRASKKWLYLMTFIGASSLLSLMIIGEIIYQAFI